MHRIKFIYLFIYYLRHTTIPFGVRSGFTFPTDQSVMTVLFQIDYILPLLSDLTLSELVSNMIALSHKYE